MVPLYIKYMGAEAYGLVGFFAMLQAWFMLLDMGLTPTMSRETARFWGGATDALSYRRLARALEGVFLIVALVGSAAMFAASRYIAQDWLQASQLPIAEVQTALQLMAIIIALRWMCGLYRGAISGSERLVWLGGFNSITATLRFIGVLPVLMYVGVTPTIFFSFQLGIAVFELAGLLIYSYHLLPNIAPGQRLPWDWKPLKPVLKFSLTIAFTSSVWVLVTQTDKLVLSKILPLGEYGYFTLAVLVAGGIVLLISPVTGALMPRMVKLEAEGNYGKLIRIYRHATQLVAVIAGAATITLAYCAEPLLWAWTGDRTIAHQGAPVLILYAIGNGILAVAGFPYLLQYAKGDLRLHLIGNALFIAILLPAIVFTANQYGSIGAGYAWMYLNILTFITWVPFVHNKISPGLNFKWFTQDVLLIFTAGAITGYFLKINLSFAGDRLWQGFMVIIFGLFVFLASAAASSTLRSHSKLWMKKMQWPIMHL